jgi:hypothetical protein
MERESLVVVLVSIIGFKIMQLHCGLHPALIFKLCFEHCKFGGWKKQIWIISRYIEYLRMLLHARKCVWVNIQEAVVVYSNDWISPKVRFRNYVKEICTAADKLGTRWIISFLFRVILFTGIYYSLESWYEAVEFPEHKVPNLHTVIIKVLVFKENSSLESIIIFIRLRIIILWLNFSGNSQSS